MTDWLRSFPLLTMFGVPDLRLSPFVTDVFPPALNYAFWSARTHETESLAMRSLSDAEIDSLFDSVAAIIDKDLRRFDPLVACFGKLLPDGDEDRIEAEREIAHCVKRDLAWAVIEKAIGVNGFFCGLLQWYDQGRWPHDWEGAFPEGHIIVA
ncbi:MAG: hypothetical protein JNL67_17835 [Planctomycetaceae bacterium]|nr:hypothetical protein [Planctomycetaceae bacterium]